MEGAHHRALLEVIPMRWLSLIFVLGLAAPAAANSTVPALPLPAGSAMIFSPGTADYVGYRIVLAPSGDAIAVDAAGRAQHPVSAKLAKALFDDLATAQPLSKLATAPCSPPATLVAPLVITYGNDTSPDIGCNADAHEAALLADAQAIAHALYVANYRSKSLPRFFRGGQTGGAVSQPAAQPAPAPQPPSGGYGGGYGHM